MTASKDPASYRRAIRAEINAALELLSGGPRDAGEPELNFRRRRRSARIALYAARHKAGKPLFTMRDNL